MTTRTKQVLRAPHLVTANLHDAPSVNLVAVLEAQGLGSPSISQT